MGFTDRYITSVGTDTWANSTNPATPSSWATMLTTAAAGDRVNIKNDGTYAFTTTTQNFTNSGTATSPIWLRGYSSTVTDGYQGRTGVNGALVTTNMPVITYTTGRLNNLSPTFFIYDSLNMTSAASTGTIIMGPDSVMRGCKVSNSGTNAASVGVISSTRGMVFNSDVNLTGASSGACAITSASASSVIDSCRIGVVSTTAAGINASNSTVVIFCTIFSTGGVGIFMNVTSGAVYLRNNTIYAAGGDGINIITATTGLQKIFGNMITDCTGDGVDFVSTANAAVVGYNRTRDNANGYNNQGDWITGSSWGDVASGTTGTSADDYVTPGSDFTLLFNSASTNANYPPYSSMGALQRQTFASGGFFTE